MSSSSEKDLKSHALSPFDFYALLGLTPDFEASELDRARRRTALKYHPDKVGADDKAAAEKFHLASIGYEILKSTELRNIYDNARSAREQKARLDREMDAEKRRLRDDLERREALGRQPPTGMGFVPRPAQTGLSEEERKVQQAAAQGRAMRDNLNNRRMKERAKREREEAREQEKADEASEAPTETSAFFKGQLPPFTGIPQDKLDAILRIYYRTTAPGETIDLTGESDEKKSDMTPEQLKSMLAPYGSIKDAFILRKRKSKAGQPALGAAVVVFENGSCGRAVLKDWKEKGREAPNWSNIDRIELAVN